MKLDFYIVCVRHLALDNSYYWLPLKIYSSRSSCIRFINNYKCGVFELPQFGILKITQEFLNEVRVYGKD